jgi:hypothetical protein
VSRHLGPVFAGFVLLVVSLAVAVALAVGCVNGSTASAAAPPGQIPTPPGLNPAGYGWEKVTPDQKGGADIAAGPIGGATAQLAVDGESVVFRSFAAFGDSVSNAYPNAYQTRRGAEGWSYTSILPPYEAAGANGANTPYLFELAADHSRAVVSSNLPLDPAAPAGVYSLYNQDLRTGQRTLLTPVGPKPTIFGTVLSLIAARPDSSRTLYTAGAEVLPEVPPNTILMVDEGNTEAISRLPGGEPTAIDTDAAGSSDRMASEDLDRVYYRSAETGFLYLWEDGDVVQVSAGEPVGTNRWVTATPDGSEALYTIVSSSTMLRRYDAATGDSTPISIPGDPAEQAIVKASDDLSRIYIRAGSVETGYSLWLWEEGQLHPVADGIVAVPEGTAEVGNISSGAQYSGRSTYADPTGRYFAFSTASNVTGYDGDGSIEVYLYDAESGDTTCVSCPAAGGAWPGGSALSLDEAGGSGSTPPGPPVSNFLGTPWPRLGNITAGGTLFFHTANALVDQDTNRTMDVYRWQDGEVSLVSSGTVSEPSYFKAATPDGSSVLFATAGRLIASDRDDLIDLYVARAGGGFPEPPPGNTCAGDGCGLPADPGPAPPSLGSRLDLGDGNVGQGRKRGGLKRVTRVRVSMTAALISVTVSQPGQITARGPFLRPANLKAKKARTYRLRLRLTPKGMGRLADGEVVRSRVRVWFKPRAGKRQVRSLTLNFYPRKGR